MIKPRLLTRRGLPALAATVLATVCRAQGVFPPINHIPLGPSKTEFTFVALGDNRPAGAGLPPTRVFQEILREVAWIHPDFVLSTGDLLYGNEESMEQYRAECAAIKPLIGAIGVPFFNAPGNHEIAGKPEFEMEYIKQFGPLYGSFEFGGCRFIALSTDSAAFPAKLGPDQYAWLNGQLADKRPSFVFGHHPIIAREGNDEPGKTVEQGPELVTKFSESNVKAVFEGHDHVFNHQTRGGVEYFIAGGAGAPLDAPPEQGGFFHFVLVHVKDGVMDATVVPLNAIDVTEDGDHAIVSSYCDSDLELGNLTVTVATLPKTITAQADKKGKMAEVPVRLVSSEKLASGYRLHLAFTLTKHRQTILRFGR
ncbi:MAG: metallophosphoesterase [Fimbriimonadaceae bacterium]|nr:metallophosphoesterase [Chthonomonadaceae bacterium]MCO5297833.1 metallophosphoesterase [Fimbriimonadaceae bacterium]